MGRPINVATIETIDQKVEELKLVGNKIESCLKKAYKSRHEEILIKYIEVQSIVLVAEYMNSKGYKVKLNGNERKYTHGDISELIKSPNKDIDADEGIIEFAKTLFNFNKGKATWNMLVKKSK